MSRVLFYFYFPASAKRSNRLSRIIRTRDDIFKPYCFHSVVRASGPATDKRPSTHVYPDRYVLNKKRSPYARAGINIRAIGTAPGPRFFVCAPRRNFRFSDAAAGMVSRGNTTFTRRRAERAREFRERSAMSTRLGPRARKSADFQYFVRVALVYS